MSVLQIVGVAMFGCAMFGFGWLLTWGYVSSLGYRDSVYSVNEDTKV